MAAKARHRAHAGCTSPRALPTELLDLRQFLKPPVISMLHHVSFGVRDLVLAAAFYDAALGPLGYRRVFEDSSAVGYGIEDGEDLLCLKLRDKVAAPGAGCHLAFAAPSRDAVDVFHSAALNVGGQSDGAPGLRPHYGPEYYAAFLVDPDGYRIEAVYKGADQNSLAPAGRSGAAPDSPPSRAELWFDELEVGRSFRSRKFPLTLEDLLKFSVEFDPQPAHTDPSVVHPIFGSIAASGWHTSAVTMRLLTETLSTPWGIVGAGVDEIRWPAPMRPGDVIHLEVEVLEARLLKSRSDAGLVRLGVRAADESGRVVLEMQPKMLVPLRGSYT